MATSALSSLGLGSSGVLSYDTIDSLRKVDESAILTPIDNKLTTNASKTSDLTVLSTLTTSLESITKSLSDELSYLKRSTTVSNTAVSVTTASGATIQDFSIHVNALAQKDIYQSNSFTSETSTFSSSTSTTAGTVVAPSATTTNGSASVTESSAVTFNSANMSYGDTLTIGGLTLTARGTITQAEAIAAFANLSSGATSGNTVNNGAWSGTLSDFNSGTASGSTLTFTSTTANTDVTDLAISATQEIGGTAIPVPASYTLSMAISGTTYNLDMTSNTTLTQLKDMINDAAGSKVTASILNVGGTNPYKLVIKSNDLGESNAISFSSTSVSALKNLGLDSTSITANHLQTASDASFTYNGVTISRSTNTISDLINGTTITLNEKQADGINTKVSVTQDLSNLKDNLTSLVSKYNELVTSLKTSTKYDSETKVAGTFQSTSQIKNLSTALSKQILSIDEDGRSIVDYGISFDDTGVLKFDATVFNAKVTSNPTDVEDFFRGSTTISATSYTSSAVSSSALSFASGDMSINGIEILFSTTGTDAATNALALKNAINAAGLTGIEATIDSNNSIQLSSSAGYDIVITGDDAKLSSVGFTATSTTSESTTTAGFFTKFDDLLKSYASGTSSIFGLFNTQLTTEKTALTKQRTNSVKKLDDKYAAMATKFAAYDSIISKLTTQFETLSQQIKASYASK